MKKTTSNPIYYYQYQPLAPLSLNSPPNGAIQLGSLESETFCVPFAAMLFRAVCLVHPVLQFQVSPIPGDQAIPHIVHSYL